MQHRGDWDDRDYDTTRASQFRVHFIYFARANWENSLFFANYGLH